MTSIDWLGGIRGFSLSFTQELAHYPMSLEVSQSFVTQSRSTQGWEASLTSVEILFLYIYHTRREPDVVPIGEESRAVESPQFPHNPAKKVISSEGRCLHLPTGLLHTGDVTREGF